MTAVTAQPLTSAEYGIETLPVGIEGVTVRYMAPGDAGFLAKCLVHAFQAKMECLLGNDNLDKAITAISYQNTLYTPEGRRRVLIAEYQGRPAGAAVLRFRDQEPDSFDGSAFCRDFGCCASFRMGCLESSLGKVLEGHCLLDTLSVEEGFRGRGIGKALLIGCDQRAREQRCHTIYLYCAVGNRAKNLYDRYGFQDLSVKDVGCLLESYVGVRRFHKMAKPL